ncbi:hypothetical protein QN277_005059 [Acacia crassicarpa]|uniref:Uncharacterized protein n=1 Tax=Acacia crassicarpa TaxID=499986 RepID=A0AAE1IYB2_9FABA|nr:hypothetical protein QN277_005059 [Acacia crassicarpa]
MMIRSVGVPRSSESSWCCQCRWCGFWGNFRWFLRYRISLSSTMSWAGPEDIYLST